ISDKHRLFVRASEYNWNQPNQGVSGSTTVSGGYSQESINTDLSIGETWVISSRAVHEIRAGFSRINNQLHSNSSGPRLNFPSVILGSPTNSPQWWKEWNIQVNDSLSYFAPAWHGQPQLKMGIQFFRPRFWGAFPSGPPHGAQFN